MKSKRLSLVLFVVLALVVTALVFRHFRPTRAINPPVEIQDGKTIDFSSGKPVVKDSAREKAAMDAAVKEMDEAVKDVTFGPAPASPPQQNPKVTAPPAQK